MSGSYSYGPSDRFAILRIQQIQFIMLEKMNKTCSRIQEANYLPPSRMTEELTTSETYQEHVELSKSVTRRPDIAALCRDDS